MELYFTTFNLPIIHLCLVSCRKKTLKHADWRSRGQTTNPLTPELKYNFKTHVLEEQIKSCLSVTKVERLRRGLKNV